jgi:hypothetical protein
MSSQEAAVVPPEIAVTNWDALSPNDRIRIEFESGRHQRGLIDAVSARFDVLWIWPDNSHGREMVHRADVARILCRTADISTSRLAGLLKTPGNPGSPA